MKTASEILNENDMTGQLFCRNNKLMLLDRNDILEAMVAFANQSKWVEVDERLPENGQYVLCKIKYVAWTDATMVTGYLREGFAPKHVWMIEGHHCRHHSKASELNFVTHWQPLPFAPEKK